MSGLSLIEKLRELEQCKHLLTSKEYKTTKKAILDQFIGVERQKTFFKKLYEKACRVGIIFIRHLVFPILTSIGVSLLGGPVAGVAAGLIASAF
ncbi:hypothetical protein RhiirA1_428885 [Rhizophagus irregularis]|uniref:Uncharacterized protein n=1 Tax=Rhizophagus irregularis TaxID=588596 RepID=A0A2I1F2G0_9GLOM|nr:hypothetical protein RhiirA1_428885 [Rhizophagus irregularis]PKY28556.1 hypothetical protein RhiirB3_417207 [Rhizophagus irregularis]CAB5352106.1 unnamed protein product [Rhizophagus irregularis]